MRPTTVMTIAHVALALVTAPAWAQDSQPRIVIRDHITHVTAARAYQGRNTGPEQTERISRKVRIGRDGRVSISNIAGDMVITTAGGDEVSIEAVKRARGSRSDLGNVRVSIDERAGRVDVRTEHEQNYRNRDGRWDNVSVDFTVTVPAGAAVDLHSVSGNLKVTGVRGALRLETISGDVTATDAPKVEVAKSVSGTVTLTGVSSDGDLSATSISGNVVARSLKVHALDLSSVSGNINVADVTCDRLTAKSVSGGVEYSGAINKGGSYDFNVHSGTVRLTLANPSGFVLNANSFSGSIRSDLPLTIGGDSRERDRRGRPVGFSSHSLRATYGDGSATLTVRTFSGDIVIAKR